MPRLPLTPLVQSLPATVPFVGPETHERETGKRLRARIGANESVFGPSPAAMEAMQAAAEDVWKYGDPENHDLKLALARHHGVKPGNIVVGEGIDGLLGYLVRMTVLENTPVVTSLGAYPTFNYHVAGYGGRLEFVPYRGDSEDPEALLAKARHLAAPLIYLANPDNPMGSWLDASAIEEMIAAMPEGSLLCLDEAYSEFAPESAIPPLRVDDPRVIRFRTFSKAYGMAGARVGYGIAHEELATAFDKVRNHFGVSNIAQAGALAALGDREHVARVQRWVEEARGRIGSIAAENGLEALSSATNFVAVDCKGDEVFARAVVAELGERGVFVRMPFAAPQNRCIRISAGRKEDLDILAGALPEALAAAGRR